MNDSMWSAVAGVNTFTVALNNESNNLSNVNTVGYKSEHISFADLLYTDEFGIGGDGKGSLVADINKKFTQGAMQTTSYEYDMSIVGDGFFTVQNVHNESYYTRAGNFRKSQDGFLENAQGLNVMGLATTAPTVVATSTTVTQFGNTHTNFLASQVIYSPTETITINAKATDFQSSAVSSGISGAGYKSASAKIADIEALRVDYAKRLALYSGNPIEGIPSVAQVSTATYNLTNINEEGDTVSIYINGDKYMQDFDTNATTTLNKLSDKISNVDGFISTVDTTTGAFVVSSLIPGQADIISGAQINDDTVLLENTIQYISGTGQAAFRSSSDALKTSIETAGAEFLELTNSIDLAGQNSLALTQMQIQLDNLEISDNPLSMFLVENGTLYMKQDENKFVVGKIVTSVFRENTELKAIGDNLYEKTIESGDATYVEGVNTLKNKLLELSNSNVAEGLVNLMTHQKAFEANSKAITTSDELLKTVIELKK